MSVYDAEWARNYERLAEAGMPGRDGLYRLCRACLRHLPADAHVLVVGCGTGSDLIPLAETFTSWKIDAIDPAIPMLEVCERRVREQALSSRIKLYPATLDAFKPERVYDGATSILVSQHLADARDAERFFAQLCGLLRPGGSLYTADMHIASGQARDVMLDLWRVQARMAGIPQARIADFSNRVGAELQLREESEIIDFLRSAGFTSIVKPFSSLIYGAWHARRSV